MRVLSVIIAEAGRDNQKQREKGFWFLQIHEKKRKEKKKVPILTKKIRQVSDDFFVKSIRMIS